MFDSLAESMMGNQLSAATSNKLDWLDRLRHRSDHFESVCTAVVLRELSGAALVGPQNCGGLLDRFVSRLNVPNHIRLGIDQLIRLPAGDDFWLPASQDEFVLLDVERSWFGGPWDFYKDVVADICSANAIPGDPGSGDRRLEKLSRIVDSGLIFFLPETRSELESRAFLNLSKEIAKLKAMSLFVKE